MLSLTMAAEIVCIALALALDNLHVHTTQHTWVLAISSTLLQRTTYNLFYFCLLSKTLKLIAQFVFDIA